MENIEACLTFDTVYTYVLVKAKAYTSCAIPAYDDSRFSHNVAQMISTRIFISLLYLSSLELN